MQKTLSSIFICFLEGYKFHVKESPIGSYFSHTFIEGKENTSSIEPKIPTTKISSCKYQFTINYVWQIMVVIFLLNQQFVSNNRKSIITEDDVPPCRENSGRQQYFGLCGTGICYSLY